jgi:two-component system cell cycle sensor histidine kinase/response regulator CckA
MGDESMRDDYDALKREVVGLRLRVAELERLAARHEETAGVSLAEREELLREFERVAHVGSWTWDIASGRVTWSDELHRILGIEPGSVTPSVEGYWSRLHPDDRPPAEAAAVVTTRDGVLPHTEFRIVRPDGSIRPTTASTVMLFDGAGKVRRIVGVVLDRTESLQAEAKLRRALGLLEEAQRFAQLGSWRYDPTLGDLEWSQEFRRIAGVPADVAASGELFLQRLLPDDRARFVLGVPDAFACPGGGEIEARLQRPDGEIRHVRVKGFSLIRVDGVRELRGTMLDVTDQVRLREELVHAQKMEAVGRLAGGIAHDFNNLLTVTMGNLDLLATRRGTCPEIENSLQALTSAASLTNRLLAFGRQAQLSLKLVAPNELVRSLTALMQRLVGDEVRLELDLAPDLPNIRVDALELERALVNLVVNARDAMPGGGAVHITTRARAPDARTGVCRVALSVGDEGTGIDDAVRPHIFEPFFTTRRQAGGTGLGLATVLGTAEQHGGTVDVDARVGGGTVFTIVLPAALPQAGGDVARPHPGLVPTRPLPSLKVLVVDDETNVSEVTRRILELRGHIVEVASEPELALAIWAERGHRIDLVLCDVVMAHMRGPELVARMAALGPRPRVLFVTGYSEEAVQARLGDPVLNKPYTTDALLTAIADVFFHATT